MRLNPKKVNVKTGIILAALIVLVSAGMGVYSRQFKPTPADADMTVWKGFQENTFGFAMRYPEKWAFDYSYDHYAKGLMDIDINNKKNTENGRCVPDYIDLKIFVGNAPAEIDQGATDLKNQLYRETELIKSSGNTNLVETMSINDNSVFKIKSEAPTLSLNGICPGPLYLIDASNQTFIYVFAGLGEGAKTKEGKIINQIVASMKIDENFQQKDKE